MLHACVRKFDVTDTVQISLGTKRTLYTSLGMTRKLVYGEMCGAGERPFGIFFPHIYEIRNQQNRMDRQVMGTGEVDLTFRRNFGETKLEEWEGLLEKLDGITLSAETGCPALLKRQQLDSIQTLPSLG